MTDDSGHQDRDWLVPNRAAAGDTCPWCGYVFKGGEPLCGRYCGAIDPAVRWEVVVLMQDLDYAASEVLGYRVRGEESLFTADRQPFTDAENALADTETPSERGVRSALTKVRADAADLEASARDAGDG